MMRRILRECDGLIVMLFVLGAGVAVAGGFMYATKDRAYTFPERKSDYSGMAERELLSKMMTDIAGLKRDVEIQRTRDGELVRVVNGFMSHCLADIAKQNERIASLREPKTHTVDIPPAAFGPEGFDMIQPQEIPFPVGK